MNALPTLALAALFATACVPGAQRSDAGDAGSGCTVSASGDGGGFSAACVANGDGGWACECAATSSSGASVARRCTATGSTCGQGIPAGCCEWRTCGYPADPVFSRACSTDADCAFDIVRVFPCDRAAIGFRADDATAFGAYRDDCVAAFSNYAGRDAGQCVSQGDDLLTDDGQRRLMGTIANVSVQCRAAVCTTTYR